MPTATASFTTANRSTTTVTLDPANGETGELLTKAVTGTFSGAIDETTLTTSTFTLKKNNTGSTLCSSVSYDSTSKVATCAHDSLEMNTSYTVLVSGVKDSSGLAIADTTATFTTSGTFGGFSGYSTWDMVVLTFNPAAQTMHLKNVDQSTEVDCT